jgi:hypothetical protein
MSYGRRVLCVGGWAPNRRTSRDGLKPSLFPQLPRARIQDACVLVVSAGRLPQEGHAIVRGALDERDSRRRQRRQATGRGGEDDTVKDDGACCEKIGLGQDTGGSKEKLAAIVGHSLQSWSFRRYYF